MAEAGDRLDFLGDPEKKSRKKFVPESSEQVNAFIDFKGVDLENYFNPKEVSALKESLLAMNTEGEETAVIARRFFWLIIRFLPLLILFLILINHEFQCGDQILYRF